MELLKKIDDRLRKKSPFTWIIGGHIYIPLLLVLNAAFFILGYVESAANDYANRGIPYDEEYASGMLVGVLISLGLLIAFCIRQIKYNSTRIVFNLTDRGYFRFFTSYFLILTLLANIPLIGNAGRYVQINSAIEVYENTEAGLLVGPGAEAHERMFYDMDKLQSGFYVISWEFWRAFLLVQLNLALLLLVVCYVKKAHFGWSMLVLNLYPSIFGIFTGLTFLILQPSGDEEVLMFVQLTIFVGIAYFIGFSVKRIHQGLKNGFTIALHLAMPVILVAYVALFGEFSGLHREFTNKEEISILFGTAYLAILIGLFAFKNVYRKRYLLPG